MNPKLIGYYINENETMVGQLLYKEDSQYCLYYDNIKLNSCIHKHH